MERVESTFVYHTGPHKNRILQQTGGFFPLLPYLTASRRIIVRMLFPPP